METVKAIINSEILLFIALGVAVYYAIKFFKSDDPQTYDGKDFTDQSGS